MTPSAAPSDDPGSDTFAAWFRLLQTPGVGRDVARRLLAGCGSPEAVWQVRPAVWRELAGAAVAQALAEEPPEHAERLAAARSWLAGAPDRRVLVLGDTDYPPRLLESPDPPLMLWLQGPAALLGAPSLAIVGSRQATAQGLDNARAFAGALGRAGLVVVSGLAQGIDAAAHEGALDAGTPTVAVVGTGPDIVFPPRHAALQRRLLAAGGLLLSEYAPGTPPLAPNFPLRNRLIAGMSLGTLVVEAALRSGSLITARLASEAGREVFAIPGSIHSPQARGCHALIRQGAKLVESAQDILEELPPFGAAAATGSRRQRAAAGSDDAAAANADAVPPDAATRALLAGLGHEPASLDQLQERTGTPAPALLAQLLELELEGRVARLPGGLFQRRGQT